MLNAKRLALPAMGLLLLVVGLIGNATAADPQSSTSPQASTPTMVSLSPEESWNCILNQHDVTANLAAGESASANGRIEFFLNRFPDAVGDIVEVTGNTSPMKMTNDFAIVNTDSSGQATATLVSTRPGDTDVTAFAPGIQDRNTHKDFGVVHWVDGCPVFPGDAENRFGTPHPMTVTINNVSDGAPVQGTSVRWTVEDDEPNARFANSSEDSNEITVSTNASGEASVTLLQVDEVIGDNTVFIEVLSPEGKTMFSHTMRKEWKQAVLDVEVMASASQIGLLADVTFDITITNTGNRDATGTELVATLPAGLNYVSSTGSSTESNGVVTWQLDTIGIDATTSVQLTAQGVRVGDFEITYRAESAEGLSDEEISSTEVLAGGLEVRKTGPERVEIGSDVTYLIEVRGTGTGASTGVTLVDTLPAGMMFLGANQPHIESGNELRFEVGQLIPPATWSVSVDLRAIAAGPQINVVRATSTEGADSSSEFTTTVLQPVLNIAKVGPEDGTTLLSENFTYTITVENAGDGIASNTTVVDTLPAGVDYVESDSDGVYSEQDRTVTWSLGNMAPGESSTVTLTVLATTAGVQVNEASVTADNAAAVTETETSTTVVVPAITIEKTGRTAIFVGNQVTYTLTATNNGEAPLTGVNISDTFAAGMSYVDSSEGGVLDEETSTVSWEIGELAIGATAEVTLTLQGDEAGTMTNTASVTAAEQVSADTTPASVLEAVLDVTILPAPGATIAITDSFDPVREGEQVEFTVTVSNQGRSPMTEVSVVVPVPVEFTIVSTSDERATIDTESATVTYAHGEALATGDSFSFTITVTANDLPEGELRHDTVTTATLTYAEFTAAVSTDEGTTVIEQ